MQMNVNQRRIVVSNDTMQITL